MFYKEENFWKPAIIYNNGTYVTEGQLAFYNGRKPGEEPYESDLLEISEDFNDYCHMCSIYNLLSRLYDKYPKLLTMRWNDESEAVSFTFVSKSAIGNTLKALGYEDIVGKVGEYSEIIF